MEGKSLNPCRCGHDRLFHFVNRGTDAQTEYGACLACFYRKDVRGKTIAVWPCKHFGPAGASGGTPFTVKYRGRGKEEFVSPSSQTGTEGSEPLTRI